jgi:Cdc6-like AAA superfamily ATPase
MQELALEILRRAGKKAEDKGLKEVTIEEIKQAIKESKKTKVAFFTSKLNEHQKVIYEILGRKKEWLQACFIGNIARLLLIQLLTGPTGTT